MITQEWTDDEAKIIEELGFSLNKKGHYTRGSDSLKDLTLTKRLDAEFDELFYQAYDPAKGLIINIAANHVDDSLINFIESVKVEMQDQFNFEKLQDHLLKKHDLKVELLEENDKMVLKIHDTVQRVFMSWETELDVLYCLLNYLKDINKL